MTTTTYSVTKDLEIWTSVFNPSEGFILAEFTSEKTSIPFNPMTLMGDGYIADQQRLNAIALGNAKDFIASVFIERQQMIHASYDWVTD